MKKERSKEDVSLLAQLLLLGVAVIWGWTFALVKESLATTSTFVFLFYRFGLAFILLTLIFRKKILSTEKATWIRGGLTGLALFGGYWLQTWGLNYTSATKSAFITGFFVVLVPILSWLLMREKAGWPVWTGALISIVGLGLLVFGGGKSWGGLNPGDPLTLLCALSFAAHIVLIGKYTKPENYVTILVAQIGVVALLSGFGAGLTGGEIFPTSPLAWRGISITGILATALAFWAQNRFQPYSTPGRTAIIFSAEPVFAGLFGYLILRELFSPWQWLGAFFILCAMLLAQLRPGREELPPNPR